MKNIIPKTLNAVWLGSVLREAGRKNLEDWRRKNPGYEMRLWIDSSLYGRDEDSKLLDIKKEDGTLTNESYLTQLTALLEWARENRIVICDLALEPSKTYKLLNGEIVEIKLSAGEEQKQEQYGVITGRSDLLSDTNMPHCRYYYDEVTGATANYSAASDILRVEMLYQEGGIYFDVEDVFPGDPLPTDELSAKYGFLQFQPNNGDSIASIPHGTIINKFRETIVERYNKLYEDDELVRSHRNPQFATRSPSPLLFFEGGGSNPRLSTTVVVSGPTAMIDAIKSLEGKYIPEASKELPDGKNNWPSYDATFPALKFGPYFQTPQQASSWFEPQPKQETVMAQLRALVREYFTQQIDEEIKKIEDSKSYLVRFGIVASPAADEKIMLLQLLKKRLNASSAETHMEEMYKMSIENLNDKQKKILIDLGILPRLERCGKSLETLIDLWNQNIKNNKLDVQDLFKCTVNSFARPSGSLTAFITDILDKDNGPDLLELKRWQPSLEVSQPTPGPAKS